MVDVPKGAINKNYKTKLLKIQVGELACGECETAPSTAALGTSSAAPECSPEALGGRVAGLMDGMGTSPPLTGMSQGSLQTTTIPTPHYQFKHQNARKIRQKTQDATEKLTLSARAPLWSVKVEDQDLCNLCSFWTFDQHIVSVSRLGG
jgi:hypothetical protein